MFVRLRKSYSGRLDYFTLTGYYAGRILFHAINSIRTTQMDKLIARLQQPVFLGDFLWTGFDANGQLVQPIHQVTKFWLRWELRQELKPNLILVGPP